MAEKPVKILAIRLARFGDIVLLLPALTLLKSNFPGSHMTFLTDHRLAPLAEMCPAIDDIIAVDRIAMRDGALLASLGSMCDVVRDVRSRKFDLAIDFHGFRETNLLTWLSGATQRIGLKLFGRSFWKFCFNLPPVLEDKSIHESEVFLRVVERFGSRLPPPFPCLVVPEGSRQWARTTLPAGPFAALFVGAPTHLRIWPPERFAAVADHLAGQFGLEVVAISGPEGESLVNRVKEGTRFPDKVRVFSNLTIPQLAAIVASARIWVSNDTGPLHLGPALGVPTLGLFSIGLPEHFRPTGANDSYVRVNPISQITVDEVIGRLEVMWSIVRRDLRH
jgi:ADP-heptose:LPS heptosyltransferase